MQLKDKVRCVAIISGWRVEGDMHVAAGSRLTDSLNSKARDFFAITDATVFDATTGEALYHPKYLAANRSAISLMFPVE